MLTQELVKELLHYEPATGVFVWKKRGPHLFANEADMRKWNNKWADKPAGSISSGLRVDVSVLKRNVRAHRLAFVYMTGSAPALIDHIDGNPFNNAFENLRAADRGQNKANSKPAKQRRFKGVYARPNGTYDAAIRYANKTQHLGNFRNPEDAASAYDAKAIEVHGAFAKTNVSLGMLA